MKGMSEIRAVSLSVGLMLFAASCKESLPPYEDPRDIFAGEVSGAYAISRSENAMKGYLLVRNKYDETLQGRAVLDGKLVLTWMQDPTLRKTFSLTDANILLARNYDPTTRTLTIDPGDSIRFGVSWDFIADDGRNLKNLITFVPDPTCRQRLISRDPVQIVISAEMLVFDRTGRIVPVVTEYRFQMVWQFVPPEACVSE